MAITKGSGPPSQFRAGDTIRFDVDLTDYPANGGWSLSWWLRKDGEDPVEIKGVAGGSTEFDFEMLSGKTASLAPGRWTTYTQAFNQGSTDSDGRITVDQSWLSVLPSPAAAETPTHAEAMLAKLKEIRLKIAGRDYTSSGSADGIEFKSGAELDREINEWQAKVNAERRRRALHDTGRARRNPRALLG